MSDKTSDSMYGYNEKIKCSVKNCVHNCQGKCQANNICIDNKTAVTEGETSCHSFELK
ncbi:MAG: DUF1540 domain-containing protein [Bacillota bacterium]|nr:DUF1540 domain-containing protein [Bacillota bacterium]